MAHAAERGWVWCRRWQGAVSVVVLQCRRIEVIQFLFVGPVNPVKKLVSVVSDFTTSYGWGLARGGTSQARGQGVSFMVVGDLNFLSV